jgi:c-di-GMP phosphodiesterase
MEPTKANPFTRDRLSEDVLDEWQNLLDAAAEILGVPAGLITRVDENEIEVLLASETEGNPFAAAYTTHYPESGWYCERTLKSRGLNLIPNALVDPEWADSPVAVGLHLVSYIGMPIERPDGGDFGTVCFLDIKENPHNDLHIKLVHQVKRMIELSLRVIFDKEEIDRRDRLFGSLSKIYPICSYCKKVRAETGEWIAVEDYVRHTSGAEASHGICPECYEKVINRLEP